MNQYNSRPLSPDTLFMDLKTPRFLTPEDLTERWKVQSVDVEISRFTVEDTWPSMKDIDPATKKPKVKEATVMYFKSTKTGQEYSRGMMIDAKENRDALKEATGAKTVGDLIGKRVTIIVGEFRKKPVLRISPTPPASNGQVKRAETPTDAGPRLREINAKYGADPLVAFSDLTKAAGLDSATVQAILRECSGDYDEAFKRIAGQYAAVIG